MEVNAMRGKLETFLLLFLVMLFAAGLCLALYPYVQGFVVDNIMQRQAEDFLSRVEIIPDDPASVKPIVMETESEETQPRQYLELWEEMTAYNESIYAQGQMGLANSYAYEAPSFILKDYGLEDEIFGVISIPKLELEMPIFLGASYQNMADGAAVLSQTSIPIGGKNTNAVIAGHRGWGGASYFRYITDLEVGDEVIITNLWETMTYTVSGVRIIDPASVDDILIREGKDMITLLTCHPYASGGKQRYLVFCERRIDA